MEQEFIDYKQKLREVFERKQDASTDESPPKYLLKGDVSGIQEFIFNVASKGAAKSLKARSYYVQVVSKLCEQFCLSKINGSKSFYNGGGNFFITIPENHYYEKILNELQTEINKEFKTDEIAITLSWCKLSNDNFGKDWDKLSNLANRRKLRRFYNDYDLMFSKFSETEQEEIRDLRWKEIVNTIERKLTYNDVKGLFNEAANQFVKQSLFSTELFNIKNQEKDLDNKLIDKLPFWQDYFKHNKQGYRSYREQRDSLKEDGHPDVLKDNNLIDFDGFADFAAYRTGTAKLAILKFDVDNLGKIFKNNIKKENDGQFISNAFELFFDQYLFDIWSKEKFTYYKDGNELEEYFKTNIYPVFAGGDDCFIIGSWDCMIDFALLLNNKFNEFIAELKHGNYGLEIANAQISLSAGIIIVNPHHPVIAISELAEHELSNAKLKTGKNCISLFGEQFSWIDFHRIKEISRVLKEEMHKNNIPRSYLDVIRQSAKGFGSLQESALQGKIDLPKIWRLKYYLGKKEEKKFEKIAEKLFTPYYDALFKALNKKEVTNTAIFPTAARLTELLTRNPLDYEKSN